MTRLEDGRWHSEDNQEYYIPSPQQYAARAARILTPLPADAPPDAYDYIELSSGLRLWLDEENRISRDGGLPAHIERNGNSAEYLLHGKHHNLRGAATSDGLFYINGVRLREDEFKKHPDVIKAQQTLTRISAATTLQLPKLNFSAKHPLVR